MAENSFKPNPLCASSRATDTCQKDIHDINGCYDRIEEASFSEAFALTSLGPDNTFKPNVLRSAANMEG